MTLDELKEIVMPIKKDETKLLYFEAAIEWLKENTTLKFNTTVESINKLPANVRLFLLRFCDLIVRDVTVQSESIPGLSQSFKSDNMDILLWSLAKSLISQYLKGRCKITPCSQKWR